MHMFYFNFLIGTGCPEQHPTNPKVAQVLGKEFSINAPQVIQGENTIDSTVVVVNPTRHAPYPFLPSCFRIYLSISGHCNQEINAFFIQLEFVESAVFERISSPRGLECWRENLGLTLLGYWLSLIFIDQRKNDVYVPPSFKIIIVCDRIRLQNSNGFILLGFTLMFLQGGIWLG